jgi:hypothetical protein
MVCWRGQVCGVHVVWLFWIREKKKKQACPRAADGCWERGVSGSWFRGLAKVVIVRRIFACRRGRRSDETFDFVGWRIVVAPRCFFFLAKKDSFAWRHRAVFFALQRRQLDIFATKPQHGGMGLFWRRREAHPAHFPDMTLFYSPLSRESSYHESSPPTPRV